MRIVYDIDFGSTYSKTHLGIYDSETNTLEYFSKTKLEDKVRKGYEVQDLALKKGEDSKIQIDIINTVIHQIPYFQKTVEGGLHRKTSIIMTQPVNMKNLKTGVYFTYKNITFVYQKRRAGNEWGIMFPTGMKIETGIQILYQMVPYLLCGDVYILHLDSIVVDTLDLSMLAQLSQTKRIKLYSTAFIKGFENVRIVGNIENIDFSDLCGATSDSKDLKVIDLSGLYAQKSLAPHYFSFGMKIKPNTLLLLPNIPDAEQVKHYQTTTEWINLGTYSKQSDYIKETKKQIAKYSLMGKPIDKYIFYAIIG